MRMNGSNDDSRSFQRLLSPVSLLPVARRRRRRDAGKRAAAAVRRTFPRTPPGPGPGSGSGSDIVRVFIEQILRPVMCVGYRSVDNIILVGSVILRMENGEDHNRFNQNNFINSLIGCLMHRLC